jgi:hypothetical protein
MPTSPPPTRCGKYIWVSESPSLDDEQIQPETEERDVDNETANEDEDDDGASDHNDEEEITPVSPSQTQLRKRQGSESAAKLQ